MYALWKTQGTSVQPWRADVRFGAVRKGETLTVVLVADEPWKGRLVFDRPRHLIHAFARGLSAYQPVPGVVHG